MNGAKGGGKMNAQSTMAEAKRCRSTVFGDRVQSWQCLRAGVFCRSGKWFCRQHDPERNKIGPHAVHIWSWGYGVDDSPRDFIVARRTAKQIIALRSVTDSSPETFAIADEGRTWFSTELAAWRYRIERLDNDIKRLTQDLQDVYAARAAAESYARALEGADQKADTAS